MQSNAVVTHRFNEIDNEIKGYDGWILWKLVPNPDPTKKPAKVPVQSKGKELCNVTNPNHWGTFDAAVKAYEANPGMYAGIGYCFSNADPYTFIDLDGVNGNDRLKGMHDKILGAFETYTEISHSGEGYHIICKGTIVAGRRNSDNAIEIYSEGRFAVFTGNRTNNHPITEQQDLLDALYKTVDNRGSELKNHGQGGPSKFVDQPQTRSDDDVLAAGVSVASNGSIFASFMTSEWIKNKRYQHTNGQPNQSAADQAFFNMLWFHSRNRDQMVRLFKMSPLGKRAKANRQDYIDAMIDNSADKALPTLDLNIPDFKDILASLSALGPEANGQAPAQTSDPSGLQQHLKGNKDAAVGAAVEHVGTLTSTPIALLAPPPGLLSAVASHIYHASPTPVPHIAMAGAIAFMAGICGRNFNVSRTGINQYVLLLAETGRGKEAMKTGIKSLIQSMTYQNLTAANILGPSTISSGQALHPHLIKQRCFLSILGEFESMYKGIMDPNASSAMSALKQRLLDLFMASGKGGSLEGTIYSDTKKNLESIKSPALSILAECTLSGMNSQLTIEHIQSGFLPRFLNIVYDGPAVPYNYHPKELPDRELVDKLCELHAFCERQNRDGIVTELVPDAEADKLLKEARDFQTDRTNDPDVALYGQLWNRFHLKAFRLAGLVCASDYAHSGSNIITADQARWAIAVVRNDIENVLGRFERFEVGDQDDDSALVEKMRQCLKHFIYMPQEKLASYKIPMAQKMNDIVSLRCIQNYTTRAKGYKGPDQVKTIHKIMKFLEEIGVVGNLIAEQNEDKRKLLGLTARTTAWKVLDKGWLNDK